jgi:hypothetical protein
MPVAYSTPHASGHFAYSREQTDHLIPTSDATPLGVAWGFGYHTLVMGFRRIALLVVIYVAWDFATPLMPGAVQWMDGSLETDTGTFARSGKDPAPAVTPLPSHLSTRKPALPTKRVISASPPAPVLLLAPVRPRSTPASSPDDD